MAKESRGGFVRWQQVTRNQFSSASNVILALATGLLAFHSNLLLDRKLSVGCAFGFAVAALFILSVSVASALLCAVSRLWDFRLTAQIARRRAEGETDLRESRDQSKTLGQLSWGLFWVQIVFFGLGAGCGAVAVIVQIWPR